MEKFIDELVQTIKRASDALETRLGARIDALDARLHTKASGVPSLTVADLDQIADGVAPMFKEHEQRLEALERRIAELESAAQLQGKP